MEILKPYTSRGIRISQSTHHESMFIFDLSDGSFYTLTASLQQVLTAHPPDNSRFERSYKTFSRTSVYKPQGNESFVSLLKRNRSYAKQSRN